MNSKDSSEAIARAARGPLYREVLFGLFAFLLVPLTIFAMTYPPPLPAQGQAHRIFYIHVPTAWVALYAPIIAAIAGVLYLKGRREAYDVWSLASTKLSFLFAVSVVLSGPIWASTEWGTYWNWKDERLMSFFVLLLCLLGYFLARHLTEDPERAALFGSIMAILAALAALLTWFAIRVTEPDTHPPSVLGGMSPKIRLTFWLSVLGYHLLFLSMLRLTVRHEWLQRIVARAEAQS